MVVLYLTNRKCYEYSFIFEIVTIRWPMPFQADESSFP